MVEAAGEGIDTVLSSVTYTLGANVENLTLTGTATINATGNTADNVLTGNSGNNILNGVSGANDVAAFNGTALAATFAFAGGVTVATQGGGTDTLQNIDSVRFGTTTYALVAGTNAAETRTGGGGQ